MGEQLFENLISIEKLAEKIGVAPKTIRNWCSLRKIPFIRVGGKTMFLESSVIDWLSRKEIKMSRNVKPRNRTSLKGRAR